MTEAIEERANTVRTTDRTSLTMDERIGSLFQSDSLLVAQYFETLRRKTLFEPEKRLMLAILEDAINCFQDNLLAQDVRRSRLFHEVEEGSSKRTAAGFFPLRVSVRFWGLVLGTYARGCCDGKKRE
jgi:hypothetical protein